MTLSELNKTFTINYEEYKLIALKHINNIYPLDIAMSNLYIHLNNYKDKIKTQKDMYAFTVQYCYRLKTWQKNRSIFLTEKTLNITDNNELELINMEDDNDIDLEETFQKLLSSFIIETNISNEDKHLITDFFTYNLDTDKKIMEFYNQRRTYGKKISKQLKQVYNNFKEYVKNNI